MKLSPEDRIITERLAAGVLCRDGFLGDDRRPLPEILEADLATVEALELTHEQIADRLGQALRDAMARYGTPADAGGGLEAVYVEAMGRIPCPFGCGTVAAKGQVELTRTATGRRICFTPLSVHLIEAHGFYQGRGSRFRLDPRDAAEILGLI